MPRKRMLRASWREWASAEDRAPLTHTLSSEYGASVWARGGFLRWPMRRMIRARSAHHYAKNDHRHRDSSNDADARAGTVARASPGKAGLETVGAVRERSGGGDGARG